MATPCPAARVGGMVLAPFGPRASGFTARAYPKRCGCARGRWDDGAVLFELLDVGLARGGRRVLDSVSAGVPGGATAIVGPSGSGKATLLRPPHPPPPPGTRP